MSFKPQGVPQAFARTNEKRTARSKDELVTIDSYDLALRQMRVIDEKGNPLLVQIRPEAIARNQERSTSVQTSTLKWEGYLIDQRMASHLKPGQKIVLERASRDYSHQQNSQTIAFYYADRILNVRDSSPDKVFSGLFSISSYKKRVFQIQRWEQKAISFDDVAGIDVLRESIESGYQAFMKKEPKPTWGVQFRVVVPSLNPQDPCTVVDISPPLDWISRSVDENQHEIPGYPLNGEKFDFYMKDAFNGYLNYAETQFPLEKNPGRLIEICTYRNYRAGPLSRNMEISDRPFDPLFKMTHTPTRLALDDTNFVTERNMAVLGILQLTADKADLTTRTFEERNIAVQLHANGPLGHVHSWIRTSDGRTTRPHEELRPKTTAAPVNQKSSDVDDQASYENAHSQHTPAEKKSETSSSDTSNGGFSDFDDWDIDSNPFNG